METDIDLPTTVTGGNTGGLSFEQKAIVVGLVPPFILVVLGILTFLFNRSRIKKALYSCLQKCCPGCQGSADENQSPDQIEIRIGSTTTRNAPESDKLLSPAVLIETSELEAHGYTELDQKSPNRQAGCGDRQARMTAKNRDMATSDYDIFLVSTSKQTPHVDKIKKMFKRNGWTFTTPFDGKLGVPVMQIVVEAFQACSYVVFLVTKDDMKNEDFTMKIEMAFQSKQNRKMGGEIIPIRGSKEVELLPPLGCLVGSTIGEDDLEKRMIKTIDTQIRMKREAQCHSVSGAPGVRLADEEEGADDTPDGADETVDSDNTSAACSGAPGVRLADEEEGADDTPDGADETVDSDNTSAACSGNADLTDIYFMELAGQSGSEWEDVVKRYIVQCVQQSTPEMNDREMKQEICNDLTKYGYVDLSEKVKLYEEFDS